MSGRYLSIIGLCLILFSACQPQPLEKEYKSHELGELEAFITALNYSFDEVTQCQESEMRETRSLHHKDLYKKYPVYYDWWLQDGDNIDWFRGSLARQLADRLQKHNLPDTTGNTSESIRKAFDVYIKACTQRREQRLASFVKNSPGIIFTKSEVLRPSFYAYTEGLSDARDECNFFPGSELSLLKMNGIWGQEETLLSDSVGVFRDPDVHFDGKHILFSWKKSQKEDDFHLYEMEIPSQKVKQLTAGLGYADIEPVYLPDGNILFNSTRGGNAVDCWKVEVSNLFLCNREGKYIRRVGYDQVHTTKPSVLDDGRVIYTRWDYNDRGQIFTQPLFQMNPDGTGQTEYYGANSFFPTTVVHARQIPGTRKIMGTFIGHHTPQHGKLGIIDPEAGRHENEGVTFVAPQRKPEAERIDKYGQFSDQFQYPYPLSEKDFLISYSPLGYYVGRPIDFAIYWMNVDGERELLAADANISCNQPVMLSARKRPFTRANIVNYNKKNGVYYMQNIYAGNGLDGIEPGTVKKLRIVEIIYRPASVGAAFGVGAGGAGHAFTPVGVGNASWDVKRILGTIDVEPDGSAFFSVPARTPLYFQALDKNNKVVQTMRSWSTLQPGETQSCVGCHEHKNTVPLTSHPMSIAMEKGIRIIEPEGIGERNFSYIKEVQPIWDAKCISCHDGVKHSMSLKGDLKVVDTQTRRKYSDSYLNLTHARKTTHDNDSWQGNPHHPEVNWISSLSEPTILKPYFAGSATSNLIKRLENGHGGVTLTKNEIETVSTWLDLLVPFVGNYKEANDWTPDEMKYYEYYEEKQKKAQEENEKNILLYLQTFQ
ncbi:hypothetical protein [Bacteroides sp. 519]|uniref:HzsA-related protein n=1 Tax=Bacteroides sp. 519 TaxID=2302937 RepID=UPI0013D7B299|nr:hypothetical protein [Bacteroides sp. 519]NDV57312.1 hypothetical protein [Bacteroides sp. 519]